MKMGSVLLLMIVLSISIHALNIFSAGSLSIPLRRVAQEFYNEYHVSVNFEFSGSVQAVRKIVELGRCPDLLFVADYSLIPKFLPQDWVVGFANNEMVLAYTNPKVGKELEEDWVAALLKLRVGISNPNLDPAGYRAIGVISLVSMRDDRALSLLEKIRGVKAFRRNDGMEVLIYPNVRSGNGVIIREKSVDLISLLKAGVIDVAFEYRSVAVQHGLRYLELPSAYNLGDPSKADFYSKVLIVLMAGTPKSKSIRLKPIVYGVTIPSCAPHPSLALKFFSFVLSDKGMKVFESYGQRFLTPMLFVPPKTVK